jgi:acyl carrier protein
MTKETFLLKLQEELELDAELTLNTNISDLDEWDSMTAMVLIGFVSNQFGIAFTLVDIESITTFESIIERIGVDKFD